jgi:hypothetical protein
MPTIAPVVNIAHDPTVGRVTAVTGVTLLVSLRSA